ncbi:MAG: toxin [Elusimicrobiota bacterium]
MIIRWDPLKSAWLKRTRGVSFEDILQETFIGVEEHPKKRHQRLMLFELDGYIWTVPYVRRGEEVFLKTLFPSRVYTQRWLRGES